MFIWVLKPVTSDSIKIIIAKDDTEHSYTVCGYACSLGWLLG